MRMPRMQAEVAQGIGAGTGVVIPGILKKYLNEPIPVISDFLGVFGKYPTFIPVATGAIAFSVAKFTNLIKDSNTRGMLVFYGITSTLTGIMLAVGDVYGFRAKAPVRANLRQKNIGVPYSKFDPGYRSSQYYPGISGAFFDRPQSMAKGWASDVTRNPMAAIPTKISSKEIIA